MNWPLAYIVWDGDGFALEVAGIVRWSDWPLSVQDVRVVVDCLPEAKYVG